MGSRLTRLDKGAEVRGFILERLGTDDLDGIRAVAIERFGEDRVPARSSIHRLAVRTRAALNGRDR